TLIIAGLTVPKGLVTSPIDLTWTLVGGVVVLGMILVNAAQDKKVMAQVWATFALITIIISAILTLSAGSLDNSDTQSYLLVMLLIGIPIVMSGIGGWNPTKFKVL